MYTQPTWDKDAPPEAQLEIQLAPRDGTSGVESPRTDWYASRAKERTDRLGQPRWYKDIWLDVAGQVGITCERCTTLTEAAR